MAPAFQYGFAAAIILTLLVGAGCQRQTSSRATDSRSEAISNQNESGGSIQTGDAQESASRQRSGPPSAQTKQGHETGWRVGAFSAGSAFSNAEDPLRIQPLCNGIDTLHASFSDEQTRLHLDYRGMEFQIATEELEESLVQKGTIPPGGGRFIPATMHPDWSDSIRTERTCSRLVFRPSVLTRSCTELFIGLVKMGQTVRLLVSDGVGNGWSHGVTGWSADRDSVLLASGPDRRRSTVERTHWDFESLTTPDWGVWSTTNLRHDSYEGVLEFACKSKSGEELPCGHPDSAEPAVDSLIARFGYHVREDSVRLTPIEAYDGSLGLCDYRKKEWMHNMFGERLSMATSP